uniref:Acetyl-CoA hydrolase n=1 Tax=Soboliphyme baturini TaxID=241478 RepID=A0A183IR94_9BILA
LLVGSTIYVHGVAATPTVLLDALLDHAKQNDLKNIKLYHIHLEGPAKWAEPENAGYLRSNCMFIAGNLRKAVNEGRADCLSVFLSDTAELFRKKIVPVDAALITVSSPDIKGYCSIGTSAEAKIGQLIAENLIEDGATLQMGIGNIPDAVLGLLKNHKNLGVHTEMFSDGILPLIECGAMTNAEKKIQPGKVVSSFSLGSRKLYDWMHENPMLYMGDVGWVNDPMYIRQNPKVAAINSCIEIDITGQIVADSIGTRMYSGIGGQVDFMRGAAVGEDNKGKPIMALTSVTKKGVSKIVSTVKEGSGVVTTRGHAHYVVTEYGIAFLFGKNMRQRAYELIKIAHPSHRKSLEQSFYDRFYCLPSKD